MSEYTDMKSAFTLGELLSALAPGSRVLDLGCGGGTFRYVDFPSLIIHALDEATHPNARSFPPHAHFVRAGASSIPEREAVFDLVIVNFAFEHFPDPVATLKEIERVGKDRAHVWISIPNAGSFEDQLYRNLFAGGGHLQSPTLERFLRLVYENTCLKLVSLLELPAGFTFLGESEELRHLTWAIIDALKRSVAIEAQSQSGYIFVLRKYAEAGPGFREFLRTCHACGTPGDTQHAAEQVSTAAWVCSVCGANNPSPPPLQAINLDKVAKAQRLQWQRFPETHPARLREMVDERGRWGQELERELQETRRRAEETSMELRSELESARRRVEELGAECERRGCWGLELQGELESQRELTAKLQAEFEEKAKWVLELDQTIKRQQAEIYELRNPILHLRYLLRRVSHFMRKRPVSSS